MSENEPSLIDNLAKELTAAKALRWYVALLLTGAVAGAPFAGKWAVVHWASDIFDHRYVQGTTYDKFVINQAERHAEIQKTLTNTNSVEMLHSQSIQKLEVNFATQQETLRNLDRNVNDIKQELLRGKGE